MLVSLWFILNNIRSIKAQLIICFLVFLFVIARLFKPKNIIIFKEKIIKITKYKKFPLYFGISILLIGIIARLSFYFLYSYSPVSDPGSFFNQAQSIASGDGIIGNRYVAFFPYLSAYSTLLGLAIKIIGNSWLATIILNTIFDIFGSITALLLVKKLSNINSNNHLAAFALWFLSPFGIIFSSLSLPIIIVNFFIIFSIYLTYLLIQKILKSNLKESLILSILLGLIIGYGNCFRPIFPVIIIAIVLYYFYTLLTNKHSRQRLLLSFSSLIIIISIFVGIQNINTTFVSRQTGFDVPSNASGWSIYVGSNTTTAGSWNLEDDKYLYDLLDKNPNLSEVHDKLSKDGIERYKKLGLGGSISLMMRKLSLFAGSQASVYDAEASVIGYDGSIVDLALGLYILFYIFFMYFITIRNLYYLASTSLTNNKINSIIIFVTLILIGLFLSDAFVESQLRYAQVVYPCFIFIASYIVKKN